MDEALDSASTVDDGSVTICRGGFLCTEEDPENKGPCVWCVRVSAEDERDPDEIVETVMRPLRH